jgi:2-methylaconitate cis-trans-isomerase PrpF
VIRIRVDSVNTDAKVEAIIQTPDGQVGYEGSAAVDGMPGTAHRSI